MSVEIPLLPLGAILFPHMPLALHIFEERYRTMLRDCEEQGRGFGIVGIREGSEIGGTARPYLVGTLAQLQDVDRLPDGRYDLVVSGASRFSILELSFERPYLIARVEYLEEHADDDGGEAVERAREVFGRYIAALRGIAGDGVPDVELPEDCERLSYLIAATLQVETRHKQELLEVNSGTERLRRGVRMMRRELVFLDRNLARRDARIAPLSSN